MISTHAVCSEIDSTQESRERDTISHHLPVGQDEFRFVSDAGRQATKATISTAKIISIANNYNLECAGVGITHTQPNTQPNTQPKRSRRNCLQARITIMRWCWNHTARNRHTHTHTTEHSDTTEHTQHTHNTVTHKTHKTPGAFPR